MDTEQRDIITALGARIATIRRARGLTQEHVADLARIDIQAIRRVETGRSALPYHRLARLAVALGTSLSDLFRFHSPIPVALGDPIEARLVASYRSLPVGRRDWAVRVVEALTGPDDELAPSVSAS